MKKSTTAAVPKRPVPHGILPKKLWRNFRKNIDNASSLIYNILQ